MEEGKLFIDILPKFEQLVELKAPNIFIVIGVLFILADHPSLIDDELLNNTGEILEAIDFFEKRNGIAVIFVQVVARKESL